MSKVWSFLKRWWWAALAAVVGIFVWVVTRGGDSSSDGGGESIESNLHSIKELAANEVERSKQDLLIETAKRDTKTEELRREISDIEDEPDTDRRRRRLSRFLEQNL